MKTIALLNLCFISVLCFTNRVYAETCSEILKNDKRACDNTSIEDSGVWTWVLSLFASCVIGLSGIVPLIVIPVDVGIKLNQDYANGKYLKLLLSFAVGGLLGDVFLHLLPEAWDNAGHGGHLTMLNHLTLGIWVLCGMFSFLILQFIFNACDVSRKAEGTLEALEPYSLVSNEHVAKAGRSEINCNSDFAQGIIGNGHVSSRVETSMTKINTTVTNIHVAGYLNLIANGIDNFLHGLAVGASFLIGCKMGLLTTFAILIHEIPHEIGDFAILLKSGFHPWTAAKAQISTATIGILGVIVALSAESLDHIGVCSSRILTFTAGGFLNIALVNVLPDILNEKDPWESLKQFVCICCGIGVMAFVSYVVI